MKTLIFGAGWIGQQFSELLPDAVLSSVDITNASEVAHEIELVEPERLLNCAGKTGQPNIDACEKDPAGTYLANVAGPIVLAAEAKRRQLHMTHMSSGCLYEGDNGGKGFSEEDPPNFLDSLYARTKAQAEAALREFGVLQLRIRMPISSEPHPRNLLTKLAGYRQTFRAANSITVLEDFFPAAQKLIEAGKTGVYNMVNPGIEYHDELLALYHEIVDPNHTFELITFPELKTKLLAGRSNCVLNTTKLEKAGAGLPDFKLSLPRLLSRYAQRKKSPGL